jgi:hypothetical protein
LGGVADTLPLGGGVAVGLSEAMDFEPRINDDVVTMAFCVLTAWADV